LLAGAGGFNCGVQGEQIRLVSNVIDHADNASDLSGTLAQFLDFLCSAAYGGPYRERDSRSPHLPALQPL
jgi:hypothetical protein